MDNFFKSLIEKTDETIYKLSDIEPVRTYEYSLPTLVCKDRFTERVSWTNSSMFFSEFTKKYPAFSKIDLKNIAIVGGCVIDILCKSTPSDIDLFIILDQQMNEQDANKFIEERAKKLMKDLYDYMKKYNDDLDELKESPDATDEILRRKNFNLDSFHVNRYKNVFTVTADKKAISCPIQIVGTHFHRIQDLFKRVDIGCTSLCYFKNEVLFSAVGKFCFENLLFFADGLKYGKEGSNRIIKYFNKGYDIIFPYLDISKVPKRNFKFNVSEVIDLPYLTIVINGIENNKIIHESLDLSPEVKLDLSGSDQSTMPGYSESKTGQSIHHNISCLVKNKWDDFVYAGEGQQFTNAFLELPLLTKRMIINTYETVKKNIFQDNKIALDVIEKYFSVESVSNILNNVLIKYVQTNEKSREKLFDNSYEKYISDELDILIAKQIADIEAKIGQIKAKKIALKPIGCRFEDENKKFDRKEWYGVYYKEL